MKPAAREGLNLIFDADDTLWHSNAHFREAEREFGQMLREAKIAVEDAEVRAAVRRFELEVIRTHGYGRRPYVVALHSALDLIAAPETAERLRPLVDDLGERFINRPCELIPGVESTLAVLAKRHRLLVFTKGQREEQIRKLQLSGLERHFSHVEVTMEKNPAAYDLLVERAGLDRTTTFMIGNSPRSDINPALQAGLGAVFIPYHETWEHEHAEIDRRDERLIELDNFIQLLEVF
jgi:putative hydrolase of the HAD superfamily